MMFRKIVSYLVSFAIFFQSLPLHAMDPEEATVLRKSSVYQVHSDKGPVNCIDVKRSKTGEIPLAFDPSPYEENTKIHLVLDHKPVGLITYLENKLNFFGVEDYIFDLRGKLNKVAQLIVQTGSLKLDVIGEATDIYVEAKKIIEAATNQLYASNSLTIKGYQDGFQHGGVLKSKNAIHFEGGAYSSTKEAQTLAGCLFQNDSKKTSEAGRVVAGIYAGKGEALTFQSSTHFLGYYFMPQMTGSLTLDPESKVIVENAAPIWAQGNVVLNGILAKLSFMKIAFPYLEFFGLGALKVASMVEMRAKAREICSIQAPVFRKINVSGISLQSEKDILIGQNATVKSSDANIIFQGLNITTSGTILGGYFEGLTTAIKAHFAQLLGGIIEGRDVSIDAKTLIQSQDNTINAQRAQFTGDTHTIGGVVNANDYVQQTTQSIDLQETARIEAEKQILYVTSNMTASGQSISHGQSSTIVDHLITTPTAQLEGQNNYVQAKQAEHAGVISGENVHCKIDNLKEASTGQIKTTKQALIEVKDAMLGGENSAPTIHVSGNDVTVSNKITGETVSTDIQKLRETAEGVIAGTKQTSLMGEEASLHGRMGDTKTSIHMSKSLTTGKNSAQQGSEVLSMKAPKIELASKATGKKVAIEGDQVHIKESGVVKSTEASSLVANKTYANDGLLASEGDIYAEIPDAHDLGKAKAGKSLAIKSQVQPDVHGIWAGEYPELTESGALHLIVPNSVQISESPKVNVGLGITAPSIETDIALNFKKDGILIATQGNLSLQDVSGQHLHLESNGAVTFKRVTFTDGIAVKSVSALNFCDHFTGKGTAQIEATAISNPIHNHIAADILSIEATEGDINNRGVMQGYKLLRRIAAGYNDDMVTWGRSGHIPWFIPAQAIGGSGVEMTIEDQKRNVGLISVAGQKVRNIGSHLSTGVNADAFIDGKYGIENISQAEKYLVNSKTKKHGFFKHKTTHYERWSHVIAESKEGIGGCMFRGSELGGFYTSGSLHAGQGEDVTNVYGPIINAAFVLADEIIKRKKKFWGMSHSSSHHTTEQAQFTRYLNNAGLYHTSRTAELTGQGTYYMAPKVAFQSPTYIHFDAIVLNHSLRTKSSAFSPTMGGIPLLGDHNINAIPGASLYQDLCFMSQSGVDVTRLVTGFQQTWSQITGLAAGYNVDQLGTQLLAQFGEIGFSFTSTRSSHKWQTHVPHTIFAEVVHEIAPQYIALEGGAQIHASQLFKAETLELRLTTVPLYSSSKQSSFKFTAGYNPYTWSGSFSFSSNTACSHGTQYHYAHINAPMVDLGVMDYLGLLGAKIICNRILGNIKHVDVITFQNEFRSKQTGWGINFSAQFKDNTLTNPTGGFNFNTASSYQKMAIEDSGIQASQGFDDSFSIDQLNVKAKQLDAALARQAKQVTFKLTHNVKKGRSFGISMQGLDLSSGKAFANGIAKNAGVLASGALAAELGKAMGLHEELISALSMFATAMVSNFINDQFSGAVNQPTSGIGILGQLNYGFDDHQINVTGIDFSLSQFECAAQNLERAYQKVLRPEVAEKPVAHYFDNDEIMSGVSAGSDAYNLIAQMLLAEGATQEQVTFILSQSQLQDIVRKSQNFAQEIFTTHLPPLSGIKHSESEGSSATNVQHFKLVTLLLDASEFVSDMAEKNEALTKFAVTGLQTVLMGPVKTVQAMAQDYVFGDTIEALKGPAIQFVSDRLSIAPEYVELAGSGIYMGFSFFFAGGTKVVDVAKDVRKTINKNRKEQPWTIRPGQEYKKKIIGAPQKTGTIGHGTRSARQAIEAAKKPDTEKVLMNRGMKKASGQSDIKPNTRADVTVVKKDGKIDQYEVPSNTDKPKHLQKRMNNTKDKLSKNQQGDAKIIHLTKEKK